MKTILGLLEIVSEYDDFIIDAWGVLHDGHSPFPGVIKTLNQLKLLKKTTVILTNSPSKKNQAISDLQKRGIDRDLYTDVVSSGEIAFLAIEKMILNHTLPPRCFFLGQKKHRLLMEGLHLQELPSIEKDLFLLNTGPNDPSDSIQSYQTILASALHYCIPMICTNPDRSALFQGKSRICAGTIAQLYEEMGGRVVYYGKPFPCAYQHIRNLVNPMTRLVAIGDSLETDIQGGINAGIDTALVLTGVTSPETPLPIQPKYLIKQLQW